MEENTEECHYETRDDQKFQILYNVYSLDVKIYFSSLLRCRSGGEGVRLEEGRL